MLLGFIISDGRIVKEVTEARFWGFNVRQSQGLRI